MKAIVLVAPKYAELREVSIPQIEDGEVLIKTKVLGICGSDIESYLGRRHVKTPIIMGHEATGIVTEVGKSVSSITVGDSVVIEPNFYCGKCSSCRIGRTNLCENKIILGATRDGAFAEYVKIPETFTWKIPKNLDLTKAVLIEPLSVILHAIKNVNILPGDNILIVGGGPLGSLFALTLLEMGTNVIIQEVSSSRRAFLEKMGLQVTSLSEDELNDKITTAFNGKKADLIIDTVGSGSSISQALKMLKSGGTIVIAGLAGGDALIPVDRIVRHEITIKGSIIYVGEFRKAIKLMEKKADTFGKIITHIFPFSDFEKAFNVAINKEGLKVLMTLA